MGCDLAKVAASIADALFRHLERQQQKQIVARTKTTIPPTAAMAMIAPLPIPFLVDLPAAEIINHLHIHGASDVQTDVLHSPLNQFCLVACGCHLDAYLHCTVLLQSCAYIQVQTPNCDG